MMGHKHTSKSYQRTECNMIRVVAGGDRKRQIETDRNVECVRMSE